MHDIERRAFMKGAAIGALAFTARDTVVDRELAESDTVTVCGPAVANVTEKVPWPLVNVESAGSRTPGEVSLLLKWTVPVYPPTGLPRSFSAVTVTLNACPAVTVAGAVTLRS